jgi:hypothetical protein
VPNKAARGPTPARTAEASSLSDTPVPGLADRGCAAVRDPALRGGAAAALPAVAAAGVLCRRGRGMGTSFFGMILGVQLAAQNANIQ